MCWWRRSLGCPKSRRRQWRCSTRGSSGWCTRCRQGQLSLVVSRTFGYTALSLVIRCCGARRGTVRCTRVLEQYTVLASLRESALKCGVVVSAAERDSAHICGHARVGGRVQFADRDAHLLPHGLGAPDGRGLRKHGRRVVQCARAARVRCTHQREHDSSSLRPPSLTLSSPH
jgi:hypothetical protein